MNTAFEIFRAANGEVVCGKVRHARGRRDTQWIARGCSQSICGSQRWRDVGQWSRQMNQHGDSRAVPVFFSRFLNQLVT